MQNYPRRITTALSVWEAAIAVARIIGITIGEAAEAVERYLALMAIAVVPVAAETRTRAITAYDRFGKSRHTAALNFGDCFVYACARHEHVPLLYKGDDFSQTDIETA